MKFNASRGGSGNPHVIKLKSGESVTGVLRGDPHEFESSFKGGQPKFRFRLNMIVNENGTMAAKILEGGWKLYSQLAEYSKAGYDLEKKYTKISRQGAMVNDTVYTAIVAPADPTPEVLAKVAQVALRDLKEGLDGQPSATPSDADGFSSFQEF